MKTVIFLADEGVGRQRPFPLIPVGGQTIIGHTLNLFADFLGDEIIIVAPNADDETAVWLADNYPDLSISSVESWEAVGELRGDVFYIDGRWLTNPNLPTTIAPAAAITDENGATTALWVQNGSSFADPPAPYFENWIAELEKGGTAVARYPAHFSFPIQTAAQLLYANKRLLGLGYGSEDLVDRSYAEDFTALPPVFLHETAVVDQCVIGPYAHLGANVHIQSSVIRNSIIGAGAQIENYILDGAIIGANAKIIGEGKAIFADNDAIIEC